MNRHYERGVSTVELVLVLSVASILLLAGFTALSFRPAQARGTALQLGAMIAAARSLAAINNGNPKLGVSDSGATIGIVVTDGHTVARLYVGRPVVGGRLSADQHVPPIITDAEVSILGGAEIRPPFAILVSSSGYAQLADAYEVNANLPFAISSCPPGGYTMRFSAGLHFEDHQLSCENALLATSN